MCAAIASALLAGAAAAQAQSATVYGALGNFDVANHSGQEVHGLEIQLEGIHSSDVVFTWSGNKYGSPQIVAYATGVYVRYHSAYDSAAQQFTAATVAITPGTAFNNTCYVTSPTYLNSGCDHFGVSLAYNVNPTASTSRWLIADPQNPGALVPVGAPVGVVSPVWTVVPQATGVPVIIAEIQAPRPPEVHGQYGDATWVKVYKTEVDRNVALEELTSDNPIVPRNPNQVETEWDILQQSPPNAHRQRGKHANSGSPHRDSRTVIRRYETYAYTGAYDPFTHEAICGGDGTCNVPLVEELGDMVGAQMTALNFADPATTGVATSGAIAPQTGWWWNPAESGRGFFVEKNSAGTLFFASYLYAAGGRATWYASALQASLDVFTGSLDAYRDGETLTGRYRAPKVSAGAGGAATLRFTDSTHGTLTWEGATTPIQRLGFADNSNPPAFQPQSGWWWNPAEGGRGFSLEIQGSTMFLSGYMYDTSGDPIWYVSTGSLAGQSYQGTWVQYANGQTLGGAYVAPLISDNAVGQVAIGFSSPTAGVMTLPDGRTIDITRFAF